MISIQPSTTQGIFERATDGKTLFRCPIHWVVSGTTSGFIVQHIERNEKYKAKVKEKEIEVVSGTEYWEAWEIDKKGVAMPMKAGINDNFGVYKENTIFAKGAVTLRFPSKENTKGRWKIRGTVYYVPADRFDRPHWYRDVDPDTGAYIKELGSVPSAGRLLSRYDAPLVGDGLVSGSLGRAVCIRKFAGTWDWTKSPPTSGSRMWPIGGNFDSAIKGTT